MSENLFRKKSLDSISSPEDMHSYMRVTSPRLWMILTAISLLLIGFIVYAATTQIENTIPVTVQVSSIAELVPEDYDGYPSVAVGTVPISYKDRIEIGMQVRLEGKVGTIVWISTGPDYLSFEVEFGDAIANIAPGEYEGELVLESTTPISFLWN